MAEQEYFKKALAGLAFDTAAGDAIRHLADIGLTVAQIAEKLDYPVKKEKIGKIVWEHFLKRGHIRTEEPGSGVGSEEYTYVTEYDEKRRKSFRRVKIAEHGTERVRFLEKVFEAARFGEFAGYLRERCRENGEENSYFTCDFARFCGQEPENYKVLLGALGQREREYILGLPWEQVVYHRLDRRMEEIAAALCATGLYRGEYWFLKCGETGCPTKVVFDMRKSGLL